MAPQAEKATDFRALHEGETFVIPNPWDAGTAKVFEALGFKALATTSSGFAFTLGRMDGNVTLDETVDHPRARPGDRAPGLGRPRERLRARARAGGRRNHSRGRGGRGGRFDRGLRTGRRALLARPRGRAGRRRRRGRARPGFPFTLTARAENHIRGLDDLDDTIARLQAYEDRRRRAVRAGLRSGDDIRAVCEAVSKPVNVLARPGLIVAEIAEAGGTRISVGGGLTWVAIGAMASAAEQIRDSGDLSALAASVKIKDWLGA